MHDSRPAPTPPRTVLRGTKADLEAANAWARALMVSLLGPDEGERAYQELPAMPVLLAYRHLVTTGEVH